jgi:hypothetical protein
MIEKIKKLNKKPKLKDQFKHIRNVQRTISDMESDGVYFSEEVKKKLEEHRSDSICHYSGLPSIMSYE